MNAVLITGCNRGLGLGLVKKFLQLERPPQHIFATVRDQSRAQVSVILCTPSCSQTPQLGTYDRLEPFYTVFLELMQKTEELAALNTEMGNLNVRARQIYEIPSVTR